MHAVVPAPPLRGLALMLGWRRLLFTFFVSTLLASLMLRVWQSDLASLFLRQWTAGFCALLAFGVFEQWPVRLPSWLARWVLQVLGVAIAVPASLCAMWMLSTEPGAPVFWKEWQRFAGFLLLALSGVLIAPWIALAALVRQKDALARHQALAFALERSQLERQALDARLRLLQAQVEPHFLFNTLANIRALVSSGSPQASRVLDSLIVYLRAAVPRLQQPATTLADELQLVRAYLQLMEMRFPDRLSFEMLVDPAASTLACPPMTLMTLVENAVRHGIDPSEQGGHIEVRVQVNDGRCQMYVTDTGVGFSDTDHGSGTGLRTLQERLQLAFQGDVQLRLSEHAPHGVCAELEFPAREAKR